MQLHSLFTTSVFKERHSQMSQPCRASPKRSAQRRAAETLGDGSERCPPVGIRRAFRALAKQRRCYFTAPLVKARNTSHSHNCTTVLHELTGPQCFCKGDVESQCCVHQSNPLCGTGFKKKIPCIRLWLLKRNMTVSVHQYVF